MLKLIERENLPRHVAIIMDGNGRWAKAKGLNRILGHQKGVDTVKKIVEAAGEIGLEYLTLYTFSMENWKRPREEVNALMSLMVDAIMREMAGLIQQGVVVKVIGNIKDLPASVQVKLEELIRNTAANKGLKLILALSYGARWEILEAAKKIAGAYKAGLIPDVEVLTEADFATYLTTTDIPDPDLLIRTSGECRLSNFLLWQCAYTEFYFIDKFWPDFEKDDLYLAIRNFQQRERRFGKTGEQLENN
ncbi:isoprenyl transferase [uncultured Odoribacter sp.]|uniref:isoprenyl transferase n=1 Tax=uncultured Odoribacter sp. TaxID=876416 RepID=UPI00260E275B|nr:isoprenyl transferase [uncultured Odoribacter sp.]